MASVATDPTHRTRSLIQVLDRYRPAAIAAVAVLVAVTVLPGAQQAQERAAATVPTLPVQVTGSANDGSSTPTKAVTEDALAVADSIGSSLAPAAPTFSAPSAPSIPSGSFGTTEAPLSRSSAPAPADAAAPATSPSEAAAEVPLRPTVTAWATATAGTPFADLDVPEGSLPVGTRLGQQDKRSYLMLTGTSTTLVLREDETGARAAETAIVQACQIVDAGWEGGEAKAFDEAPEHDPAKCVSGSRGGDGNWSFDLSSFAAPTDERGVALLSGPDAPIDFQVAFTTTD